MEYRLSEVQSLQGQLGVIYDIGANKGDWTQMVRAFLPSSKFYLFEANESHSSSLGKLGHPFFIDVLSDTVREVQFFGDGDTGDSYHKENTVHYDDKAARSAKTKTLDKVVDEQGIPMPDFIKLDTQGSEIDILRGGDKVLSNAKIVFLECPILQYNLGAPKIQEYLDFFTQRAFSH